MASRAEESDELSSLHRAKSLYFVFILFILKAKSTIWRCSLIALNFRKPPNALFAIYRVRHLFYLLESLLILVRQFQFRQIDQL
jgi:hypothetical protein